MMAPLSQEFRFLPKTGRPASFGQTEGAFPFFTSSPIVSKWTDRADCEGPALVFGTGGSASVHYVEGPFSATNDCYVAVPKSDNAEDAKFFYRFLQTNMHLIENGFRGAGLKHVSKKHLERLEIPIGGEIDRASINAILDKADCIRRKRQRVLGVVGDLLKSEFIVRFGTPFDNIKSLPKAPIKEFGKVITGNTPPRKQQDFYGDEIEWIKSDNINTPSHFLTRSTEHLSSTGKKVGRTAPAGSTLVTCIAGSPNVIGNAALADREVAFNQQINAVIPSEETDSYFLYSQFLVAKRLVQESSTNSMKGMISKGKFQEIEFLRPSYDEQAEFGKFFVRLTSIAGHLEAGLAESERLFGSLSQRAFHGEL